MAAECRRFSSEFAVASHAAASPKLLARDLHDQRLRRVLEMIESEPSRNVTELAEVVHLSPAHLQRLFKRQAGIQIGGLVAEYRLQKAARLISATRLSIKEIAHAVGYTHYSSFVRAFQRRFDRAPRRYRNSFSFRVEKGQEM